ncbi:tripartite tricarboxylate transporter substrate binding protein [Pantoea sp. 18069]|uniref:Bug family tripartite tricarboxylate transporter substrate binding protein n=1 Tax=Pantoea sp. 18069 TaxID=2681415 RepID=UPI001357EB28|nr:tripartite tricarboxylate transporter substrate-binding protein [Pantoea sp. 18069]
MRNIFSASKNTLAIFAAGLCLSLFAISAQAAYPEKPISIVVPFGAGSGTDMVARAIAKGLTEKLGQPVAVENRPGAGGGLGSSVVARSAADGYTFLMGTNGPMAANASLYSKLPYDPDRDFEAVALMGKLPMILVGSKQAQAKDLKELIAQAKAQPGVINFGASNTTARVWVELLKKMAGIQIETVIYKDVSTMMTDLISGRIQYAFENVGPSLAQVQAGKLNGIAVTANQRASFAPDIPATGEYGLNAYELVVWYALFAPKNTPADVIHKVNAAANEILRTPDMQRLAHQVGLELGSGSAEEMKKYQRAEIQKWKNLVDMTGVKID